MRNNTKIHDNLKNNGKYGGIDLNQTLVKYGLLELSIEFKDPIVLKKMV